MTKQRRTGSTGGVGNKPGRKKRTREVRIWSHDHPFWKWVGIVGTLLAIVIAVAPAVRRMFAELVDFSIQHPALVVMCLAVLVMPVLIWRMRRHRYVWIAVAGLLVVLTLVALFIRPRDEQPSQPSDSLAVYIANFDGPAPQEYRVTDYVLGGLRRSLEGYPDVAVMSLGRSIAETEGSELAREEGNKHNADIVIWGWYGKSRETVVTSVHFEVLAPLPSPELLGLGPEIKGAPRKEPSDRLDSFELQTRLSEEMAYLTQFVVGVVRYLAKDWQGTITHASAALNQVRAHNSDSPYLSRGSPYYYNLRGIRMSSYVELKEFPKALRDANELLTLDPKDSEIYYIRSGIYSMMKKEELELADLNYAIALAKTNEILASRYRLNRGYAYLSRKEPDKALADFNWIIDRLPKLRGVTNIDWKAYFNRGKAHSQEGRLDRAIADFGESLKLKKDADTYVERGAVHTRKSDLDKAIQDFDQAIVLDPDNGMAFYHRGLAHFLKNENDVAIADLDRSITLVSGDLRPLIIRGNAYRAKNDTDRAIKDYSEVIRQDPKNGDAYYERGSTYFAEQKYDASLNDLNSAIANKKDDADYYLRRAMANVATNRHSTAIRDYSMVLRFRPRDVGTYVDRGIAYVTQSDYSHAIADFSAAIRIDRKLDLAYINRAGTYSLIGQRERAIADYEHVLNNGTDRESRHEARERLQELR